MGHVKANAQVDSNGNPSGNTMLEITYGGHESPFGGLDTSAPPAYIDPKCFAACDGFIVADNKLILASLSPATFPALWGGVHAVPIKFGTYYDSIRGQLNYGLGVLITTPVGPPLYTTYVYYLTVWDTSNNIIDNQTLSVKLWQSYINAVPATLTLPVISGELTTFTDTGTFGIQYGVSGVLGGNVTVGYAPGDTQATVLAALVTALNLVSGATGFTAAPSSDGYSLVLTAVTAGVSGNTLCVWDFSGSVTPGISPAFYFPITNNTGGFPVTFLGGGIDQTYYASPSVLSNISATSVGGVLYFANLGPLILKYSVTNGLDISTTYNGVKTLRKFAGSLIGLGVRPALNIYVQNQDMIFAWSAANNLDEWNPVNSAGNVTGAGFAQLADIADSLNGLIVSNNTAFILRAQGISYATATGNSLSPFQFAHIGLGNTGEGAQNTALVAQYDQTGVFVGNTEVFQVSGSITPIGQKISQLLFADLNVSTGPLGAEIYPSSVGDTNYALVIIMIGTHLYLYNTANHTWTYLSFFPSVPISMLPAMIASVAAPGDVQVQYEGTIIVYSTALGYAVKPYLLTEGSTGIAISLSQSVTFPQEELLFGRDVTIDALYIALTAQITGTVTIEFDFNGILFSVITLDPTVFTSLNGLPVELKVFPTNNFGTGIYTSHSPQLKYTVIRGLGATITGLRFTKIQIYGSFDPAQRPV